MSKLYLPQFDDNYLDLMTDENGVWGVFGLAVDNNTGKSLSEALILWSTNPQYDKRLFIDLPVQYMKTTSSEHVVYINCSECQNKNKKQFMYTTCSELVIFMYWTHNSMKNVLSYCWLVDARISTSEKYLPVTT